MNAVVESLSADVNAIPAPIIFTDSSGAVQATQTLRM